jgi:hypothetical protein
MKSLKDMKTCRFKIPPFVGEKVTFMTPFDVSKKVNHPYSAFEPTYKHHKETRLKYPNTSLQ